RPLVVLAVRGHVRLCASLQVDGRESSGRALDPGRLSPPPPRGGHRVVERARASGLRREDPVRAPGGCGICHCIHGAVFCPDRSLAGSTERAGPAGGLSVRLELLPREAGRTREPLASLRTAAHGESRGAAVHPELRSGSSDHCARLGPPPASAGPAGDMVGLHSGPPSGARDLSERLWAHALAIDPDSPVAQNNFGYELDRRGKLAEAIDHYRQALRIKPDYALAHTNWGAALGRQGKPAEAIDHYRQALRIKPGDALAHTNWGVELAQQGKLAEAIEHFQEALRIKPDDALAHTNLGLALTLQGKLAEAFEHLQ